MANEWFSEEIKKAKEILDQAPEKGEIANNVCDGILFNLKAFITDEKIYETVDRFEQKVNSDFRQKEIEARSKLKGKDQLTNFNIGIKYYMDLRNWRSAELLNMWNRLVKDTEL